MNITHNITINSKPQMKDISLVIHKIIKNTTMQVITLLDTYIWLNKVTPKYISIDKLPQSYSLLGCLFLKRMSFEIILPLQIILWKLLFLRL